MRMDWFDWLMAGLLTVLGIGILVACVGVFLGESHRNELFRQCLNDNQKEYVCYGFLYGSRR